LSQVKAGEPRTSENISTMDMEGTSMNIAERYFIASAIADLLLIAATVCFDLL
jgi:hypothetical protein